MTKTKPDWQTGSVECDLEWLSPRNTPSMHTRLARLSVNYQVRHAYICIYS